MLPTTRNQSTWQYIYPRLQSVVFFVTVKIKSVAAGDNKGLLDIGCKILCEFDHVLRLSQNKWEYPLIQLGDYFPSLDIASRGPRLFLLMRPHFNQLVSLPVLFFIPANDVVFPQLSEDVQASISACLQRTDSPVKKKKKHQFVHAQIVSVPSIFAVHQSLAVFFRKYYLEVHSGQRLQLVRGLTRTILQETTTMPPA